MNNSTNNSEILSTASIDEIRKKIHRLKNINLKTFPIEAVQQLIGHLVHLYPFQCRPIDLTGLYRARKNNSDNDFLNARDLWYPTTEFVKNPGRLNNIGQSIFYATDMPNSAVFEMKPNVGERYTILISRPKENQILSFKKIIFLGVQHSLALEMQHILNAKEIFRDSQKFRNDLGEDKYNKYLLIDDYLSSIFTEQVSVVEEYKYKPTIALANLMFSNPNLDAVCYPSVATEYNGINIALLPKKADEVLIPSEAWVISIVEKGSHPDTGKILYTWDFLKRSKSIEPDGTINWLKAGEEINAEEIKRFVRSRVESLNQWPKNITTK